MIRDRSQMDAGLNSTPWLSQEVLVAAQADDVESAVVGFTSILSADNPVLHVLRVPTPR